MALTTKLIMSCLLSFKTAHQFTTQEKGFTRENLATGRGNQGRTINFKALSVCAECKKALLCANECAMGESGDPSGAKCEDLLLCVRQKMFMVFQGKKDENACTRLVKKQDECTARLLEEDMPKDCFFAGFFAFALFGPQGLAKTSPSCFAVDGLEMPRVSRKQL